MSALTKDQLNDVAAGAEADLNTYQSKTGAAREQADDAAGVRSNAENKFPGADVKYGDDLSTNAGYNKRIPPEEGGDRDARGRQARGEHYDHNKGDGGPAAGLDADRPTGQNDTDVYRIPGIDSVGA
ncbi:hypothetical protein ACHAQA_006995 [Verticillium albo-atrum]